MAWVRGQERLVYQRVFLAIRDGLLSDLGWDGVALGRMPYGAAQSLTVQDLPQDPKLAPIAPNLVAITEGLMPDDEDLEMGFAPLQETEHTIFVDVYGESISIAKAIAGDVRSILTGRAPGSSRYLDLPDYGTAGTPVLPGHLIHFEDIQVAFPDGLGQAHWAVVKATAVHEWNP